jgi:hypothetical protein
LILITHYWDLTHTGANGLHDTIAAKARDFSSFQTPITPDPAEIPIGHRAPVSGFFPLSPIPGLEQKIIILECEHLAR